MAEENKKLTLNEQAEKILEIAENSGVQANFFFVTTFKRYKVQINILTELEAQIKKDGVLVTKQYVKGRENVYSHPAISDYNRTTDSANKTVTTLMKIIRTQDFNKGNWDENNETKKIKEKYIKEYNLLKGLKDTKINDSIAMTIIIIYFIYKEYHELLSELSRMTGMPDFVIKKTLSKRKKANLKDLVKLKKSITEAEYRIKSGLSQNPESEVENAILR